MSIYASMCTVSVKVSVSSPSGLAPVLTDVESPFVVFVFVGVTVEWVLVCFWSWTLWRLELGHVS